MFFERLIGYGLMMGDVKCFIIDIFMQLDMQLLIYQIE